MKRRNEVLVGLLLTVALALGIAGTIWLVRGGLRSGYPIFSVFRWGANLKVGQPVRLAGVQIGYVKDVRLGMNGTLLVEMAIQDEYNIPSNAKAEVQAVGLFGDAQIGLNATPSTRYYAKGDTIPAAPASPGIPELTAKADSVATVAVDISKRLQSDVVASGGLADVRQALARTNALVAQIGAIAAEQSRQLTATQATVRRSLAAVDSATIDSTLRSVRATAANAALLSDSLRATLAQVNATLGDLRAGKGTAGKLLTDTLLYADLRRLVTRFDSLATDFERNPKKYVNLRIF